MSAQATQEAVHMENPEAAIVAALGARSVVLVGMMGAGKSSIGRRLAARLTIPFSDADTEIETAAGMSIPDIFSTYGEAHFRDGEMRVIARLHFHPVDEIGLGRLHPETIVKTWPLSKVEYDLRELARHVAVFAKSGRHPDRLRRRGDLQPHLVGKFLA